METANDFVHCRLCAENKVIHKVYNLETNEKKCSEVLTKLSLLNIDVSVNNPQYTTVICLVCYDSLNKAYEFLCKVKKAQAFFFNIYKEIPVVNGLSTFHPGRKHLLTDNNCPTFEEILASQSDVPNCPNSTSKANIEVKLEAGNSSDIIHDTDHLQDFSVQTVDQGDSLSVQEILDAALNTSPFNTDDDNIEIYAKEVPMLLNTEKKHKEQTYRKKTSKVTVEKKKTKAKIPKFECETSKTIIKGEVSWTSYPWVCAYCRIEFHSVEMLREHAKMIHGKCGAFSCVDCKYYGQKDDFIGFIKHVRKHREELRDVCHYCDCVVKPRRLQAHVTEHLPHSSFTCLSCGEPMEDEESFRQHIQNYMTEPRKKRRKPNTPITEADLTCAICKNVYKTLNSLRDHIKNQHQSDRRKEFTCERCGKTFFSKGTLTSHVMKHDNMKPHVCRICSKSFLFPNLLRRHVESHSGIKPYPCSHCPKRFRLRQQLVNHSVVHSDHMPFRCQYCSKAFRFKQILVNHERQHTGAKPYECSYCGMQFSCWSNYNKHMKRRHNTDTARKKITAQGMFPIDPVTGQVIQPVITDLEEWKSQIMLPVKRGKKPVVKAESVENV